MIEKYLTLGTDIIKCPYCDSESYHQLPNYILSDPYYECNKCGKQWWKKPMRKILLNMRKLPNGFVSGYCNTCMYFNKPMTWTFGVSQEGRCDVLGKFIKIIDEVDMYPIPEECQLPDYE